MEFYQNKNIPFLKKEKKRSMNRCFLYLPAFVLHAIIGILLTDELVDTTKGLLPVLC